MTIINKEQDDILSKLCKKLPEELKNEVLLYLNDYVNNLFIYIYDIKKKKVLRKVNKQSSFVQILKDTVEFVQILKDCVECKKKKCGIHLYLLIQRKLYKKNPFIVKIISDIIDKKK